MGNACVKGAPLVQFEAPAADPGAGHVLQPSHQQPASAAKLPCCSTEGAPPPACPRPPSGSKGAPSPRPAPKKICFAEGPATEWQIPAVLPDADAAAATSAQPQQPTSRKRLDCRVKDAYKLGKTLGTGGFAIVKLATDRKTTQQFAVKIMTLPPVGVEPGDNESTREDIFKEIDILCGLNHENVVYLKEYFEEGNKVYLITELVTGGELLEAVLQRGTYSEAEARLAFVQLLKGIEYLHSKNVVHRDLKLENLLLASPDEITKVKIADFGLAKQSADAMSTVCGTPQYVAPEVIQGTANTVYGPEVDMWSAGVVLFILLGGYPPFWSESEPALFDQIRRGRYSFDDPVWDVVSDVAKDLIRKLLVVDPCRRLTAAECLKHPWITAGQVSSDPLTEARSKMQALSMKAPGFAAAMAAASAYEEVAVGCGPTVQGSYAVSYDAAGAAAASGSHFHGGGGSDGQQQHSAAAAAAPQVNQRTSSPLGAASAPQMTTASNPDVAVV